MDGWTRITQALRPGGQEALTARTAKRPETALSAGTVWMKPTATHSLRVIRRPGRERQSGNTPTSQAEDCWRRRCRRSRIRKGITGHERNSKIDKRGGEPSDYCLN